MSNNYIVMRASPDWLNFDLEESRSFCRRLKLREDLIIEFAERWRQTFAIPYCEIRHELKSITLAAIAATRDCRLGSAADLDDPADDDLFVFIDDDDWSAPHLFEALRSMETPPDGWFWGSVFLGKFLVDAPGLGDVRGAAVGSPILQKRALQDFLYTNNYAVSGRAVKRLGIQPVFEHLDGQEAMLAGHFLPVRKESYLSCANKHPWCTMAIMHNSRSPDFLDRLDTMFLDYAEALNQVVLDADTQWIAPHLDALKSFVARISAARL